MADELTVSVADVANRFRPLGSGETAVASHLIDDAIAMVLDDLDGAGIEYSELSENRKAICLAVVCEMVRYALDYGKGADVFGSNMDYTAFPSDNTARGVALNDRQRRMLGTIASRACFAGPR